VHIVHKPEPNVVDKIGGYLVVGILLVKPNHFGIEYVIEDIMGEEGIAEEEDYSN